MEPRALLATFTVNTPQDLPAPQDGLLSLRAALGLANQTNQADTIVFDSAVFATRQTITLFESGTTADTLSIDADVTIDGPAVGVVVRRDATLVKGGQPIFAVATGVDATLRDLTISGARGVSAGGGVNNKGSLTMERCTVQDNRANRGGGIYNATGSQLVVRDSTFANNRATSQGGAIYNAGGTLDPKPPGMLVPGGTVSLTSTTVSGNQAGSGGGLFQQAGTKGGPPGLFQLRSSIVAGNRLTTGVPGDLAGIFSSLGHNLVGAGDGATGLTGNGDQVGTAAAPIDPRLGPLASNGGPTQTMAPLDGSPALYGGDPALAGTTDPRGVIRPSLPSVGAFQRLLSLVVTTRADRVNIADTSNSLREAMAAAASPVFPGANTITFDPAVFGTNSTITLSPALGTLELGSDVTIDGASLGITIRRAPTATPFGIVHVAAGATATLRGLEITGGAGFSGTGIANEGDLTVERSLIQGNAADTNGGGILNLGSLAVVDTTILGNTAGSDGGGIGNYGSLSVTNSDVEGNSAGESGGGLMNADAVTAGQAVTATVSGTTLGGNSAAEGGGISNGGSLVLSRSTLAGNTTTLLNGGGLDNTGSALIDNSTFANNTAAASGGAISFFGGSPAASLSVLASTVAGNSAGTLTGGIYFAPASGTPIALRSTIVAGNSLTSTATTTDVFGPFSSGGFNLVGIGDGATGLAGPGDRVGTAAAPIDPRLGPLADNGGPTQTMALLDGSPALLKGDPALALSFDQRGVARVAWPGVDVGAYQRQAEAPSLVVNTAADVSNFYDNRTSLREALAVAGSPGFPGPDTITFDPTVFATARTITLAPSLGTLTIATDVTIDAPAVGVTIARNDVAGVAAFRPISVAAGATVTLDGLTVRGGRVADDGGGLLNLGNLTIRAGSFRNNSAGGDGGAIANRGTLFVATSSFLANAAGGDGGSVANAPGASATIQQSSLSGNAATGLGGGLWNAGTASVGASLLDSNSAASGGGAYNAAGSTLGLVNSTLHGNRATGQGGGLANFGTASVTLSTIARNRATQGGGVLGDPAGDVRLSNSLIALNTASPGRDVSGGSGAFTSLGHNLVGVAGANERFGISTDLFGTPAAPIDPLLSPLGAYGGPTQTVALLPGSPAIDAADPAYAGSIDQRGVVRNVGSAPDIGAFESRGFSLAIVSGSDQSALVGGAFASPLVVSVASAFGEPVAGGLVDFAAPTLGASASLSTRRARIAANGQASVTATANDLAGTYQVLASTGGAGLAVSFRLTNDTPA
jgi:hypothetical protein